MTPRALAVTYVVRAGLEREVFYSTRSDAMKAAQLYLRKGLPARIESIRNGRRYFVASYVPR